MAKKRLPRLSYANWQDCGRKAFTCAPEDWARFGGALGIPLRDTRRRAMILDAVRAYLRDVRREAGAPLARDEAAWLNRLRDVADNLRALVDEAKISTAERSGLAEVQAALNGMMVEPPPFDLMTVPLWLDAAIDKVQSRRAFEAAPIVDGQRFAGLTGSDDGDAWRIFVRRLAGMVRSFGAKVAIRGDDKAKAFAKFVFELQKHFPPQTQRHMHSVSGLAKAMERALAEDEAPPPPPITTAAEWLERYNRSRRGTRRK
jgi:hypothetical protein